MTTDSDDLIPLEGLVYASGYEQMYGVTDETHRYYSSQQRRLRRFDSMPACDGGERTRALERQRDELLALGFSPTVDDNLFEVARVDFIHSTAALEGSTLSVHEVSLMLNEGIVAAGKPLREHVEVVDIDDAFGEMVELVGKGAPVSIETLCLLHSIAARHLHDCEPGELRWDQRYVAGSRILPPPPEMVRGLLERAVDWYNENPGLERAAAFHLIFEDVHPFQDGNGRVGRIALNQMLMLEGYPMVVLKPDDEGREAYYQAVSEFVGQTDARDASPFVRMVQDRLQDSLGRALGKAKAAAEHKRMRARNEGPATPVTRSPSTTHATCPCASRTRRGR